MKLLVLTIQVAGLVALCVGVFGMPQFIPVGAALTVGAVLMRIVMENDR